jgi:hypothetical protein
VGRGTAIAEDEPRRGGCRPSRSPGAGARVTAGFFPVKYNVLALLHARQPGADFITWAAASGLGGMIECGGEVNARSNSCPSQQDLWAWTRLKLLGRSEANVSKARPYISITTSHTLLKGRTFFWRLQQALQTRFKAKVVTPPRLLRNLDHGEGVIKPMCVFFTSCLRVLNTGEFLKI